LGVCDEADEAAIHGGSQPEPSIAEEEEESSMTSGASSGDIDDGTGRHEAQRLIAYRKSGG
jgi:hypothetical protein